jgi:leucyl aminopeptidase
MDFKTQVAEAGDWRTVAADALLVVVCDGATQAMLGKALWSALSDALEHGDFEYKAGRCLYLHRPGGLKVARVVFAAAANATPKAFRAALVAGLGLLKGGGAKHLAVAFAGPEPLTAAHARALASAVADGVYVYRHTKPSAPAASKLQRVSLLCAEAQAAALRDGLRIGSAIAEGVTLAREFANRPANHCTPSDLADQARKLGKEHDLQVEVLGRKEAEKLGMGCFLAVAQASSQPPKFIVVRYQGAAKSVAPLVLVGKGVTFDTGGISIKPAGDMDEMKFSSGGDFSRPLNSVTGGPLPGRPVIRAPVNRVSMPRTPVSPISGCTIQNCAPSRARPVAFLSRRTVIFTPARSSFSSTAVTVPTETPR